MSDESDFEKELEKYIAELSASVSAKFKERKTCVVVKQNMVYYNLFVYAQKEKNNNKRI